MSMVTYITQVRLYIPELEDISVDASYDPSQWQLDRSKLQAGFQRFEAALSVLIRLGFQCQRHGMEVVAYSDTVEAFSVKAALQEAGVSNHDFSIHLDYTRKWGTL